MSSTSRGASTASNSPRPQTETTRNELDEGQPNPCAASFRFAPRAQGNDATSPLSPGELIRRVWGGEVPADAYDLVVVEIEDSHDEHGC